MIICFHLQMFNNTNLIAISSSGDIKKYTFAVFRTLFSSEEMIVGAVEPSQKALNNGKRALNEERLQMLKSKLILLKFLDML